MQILDQLGPFFSYCQFFGFIPFFVETDALTKKFKKFSFSARHPITWWFTFILLSQAVLFYFDMIISFRVFYTDGVQEAKIPFVFLLFISMEHISFFVLAAMTRYAISKFSHIRRMLNILVQVHNELFVDDDVPLKKRPSVSRRAVFAIVSSIILASIMLVSTWSLLEIIEEYQGPFFVFIVSIFWFFLVMLLMCSYASMYLSYYVVSSYIDAIIVNLKLPLQSFATFESSFKPSKLNQDGWYRNRAKYNNTLRWKEKLKLCKKLFGHLCDALIELNAVFSVPSIAFLLMRLVSTAFSLYVTVYGIVYTNEFIKNLVPTFATLSVIGFLTILIVFSAADLPITQTTRLRERIFTILSEDDNMEIDDEMEALSFLQHLSEDRIRLSAAGLFHVGMHLLPSLIASIITYLIILLQTKLV